MQSTASASTVLMSWSDYVDLLKPAEALVKLAWGPDDDQIRAEVYRQLLMNLAQGYFLYFQADPEHPDWAPFENSVFLAQPNPDAVYYYAPVRGEGVYRIVGERGNAPVVGFATGKVMIGMGDPPGPGFNNYDVDALALEADGSFEVVFSEHRPPGHSGNWLYLHPEARFILLRQFSYDWGRERDVRLAIERLDTVPPKSRASPAAIDKLIRELLGGYAMRLSKLSIGCVNRTRDSGFVNTMRLTSFQDLGNGGDWPQAYFECAFEIEPGEVLILETDLPASCHYWNVQVIDQLWNQVELVQRQSSLNGLQARVDADGKFRAVLSVDDPGIHNWLDCAGHLRGMLIGRWYRASSHPTPSLKKVPFHALRDHLPASTPLITPGERAAALSKRRIGAQLRRRW
ncbi:MAG: DUF1214 domain-containing protein [Steroidobacteraceae bacterium]